MMDFEYTSTQQEIREAVRRVCDRFGLDYWRECDETGDYPRAFVDEMTKAGWLAALIPEEYGGSGLGILDACVILEEINRSGGNGAACHAQMYTMASLLRHGSEAQKRAYLPRIADGSLRLQAFGVTEPDAGSNTLRIKTSARKVDGGYRIDGQKIWTSRYLYSDLYLLLARTTPIDKVERKTAGLSLFLVAIAAGTAVTWGIAQAQAPATPATQAPAAATAPAAAQLTVRDVYDRMEAAGYRDIREIEWDHGRYEVKASNAQGERVKLYVNATTGAVESTRTRTRR